MFTLKPNFDIVASHSHVSLTHHSTTQYYADSSFRSTGRKKNILWDLSWFN